MDTGTHLANIDLPSSTVPKEKPIPTSGVTEFVASSSNQNGRMVSDPPQSCLSKIHNRARLMVLAGNPRGMVAAIIREGAKNCKPPLSEEQIQTIIEVVEAGRLPEFEMQDFDEFKARHFPDKEALIEDILFKRDLISLTGRRRHGKTTLLSNLIVAGASGRGEYLGYRIKRPFTTVVFYLEDDGAELQNKIKRMAEDQNVDPKRLHIYIRQDFYERGIKIDFSDPKFRQYILSAVAAAKEQSGSVDLIVFDNLGMLIGGDYNNSKTIHALMQLVYELTVQFDAAVLIAAHPRKGNRLDSPKGQPVSLRTDPERFFEECMGSSHFINSTGSLWGIERDKKEGRTYISLGAQRANDTESLTAVEKNDSDWFERVDDLKIAFETVVNTETREKAWHRLPENETFTYSEAQRLVKPAMKSAGSFTPWWNDLRRQKLIEEVAGTSERYQKAKGATASKKPPQSASQLQSSKSNPPEPIRDPLVV